MTPTAASSGSTHRSVLVDMRMPDVTTDRHPEPSGPVYPSPSTAAGGRRRYRGRGRGRGRSRGRGRGRSDLLGHGHGHGDDHDYGHPPTLRLGTSALAERRLIRLPCTTG